MRQRQILAVPVAALVAVLDQISKAALKPILLAAGPQGMVVTGFLRLIAVHNRGVSFGMFNHSGTGPQMMIALAAVIVTALLLWLTRTGRWLAIIAIGGVIGGALGNAIDRYRDGTVFDFLDFHIGIYAWPAFNLADSAICLGAGLLLLDSWLSERKVKGA